MPVFFLFGGWCDCLSLSDPYQSWCVQDTIDPMCRDRHANCYHWTRCLAQAKHHPNTRKTPENADDSAAMGTFALTPDDPKHELACCTLWTFKDDVPPFWWPHCLSSDNMVCAPPRFLSGSVEPKSLSFKVETGLWMPLMFGRTSQLRDRGWIVAFARSCAPTYLWWCHSQWSEKVGCKKTRESSKCCFVGKKPAKRKAINNAIHPAEEKRNKS